MCNTSLTNQHLPKKNKIFRRGEHCSPVEAIHKKGLENTVQNINVKAFGIQSDNTGTMKEAYTKYINQNK